MEQAQAESKQEQGTSKKLEISEVKQIDPSISHWIGALDTVGTITHLPAARTAIYEAMNPGDPVEAMIISQIAALHELTMVANARAIKRDFNPEQMMHAVSKLSSTFMKLVDSLNAYRGKQIMQHIRVEQVKVEAGAQAIVGGVSLGADRGV